MGQPMSWQHAVRKSHVHQSRTPTAIMYKITSREAWGHEWQGIQFHGVEPCMQMTGRVWGQYPWISKCTAAIQKIDQTVDDPLITRLATFCNASESAASKPGLITG